jgi:hypothetical protein
MPRGPYQRQPKPETLARARGRPLFDRHDPVARQRKEDGWSVQSHLDKPYPELAEVDNEDNRAAARRRRCWKTM